MKQVWQAYDGTIFEKEVDCGKYENKVAYKATLVASLTEDTDDSISYSFINNLEFFVKRGFASKLINFINSIGEQNANN